ncbi:MAG: hypothetical protein J6Y52_06775 [Bacteroidales bacterium]|nr:hypothetical protein [Bacteroidales bacterium]
MTKQEKINKAVSLLNIASQSMPDDFGPVSRAISIAKNSWIPYINSFESKSYADEGDTCVYDGYAFLESVDYNGECSDGLEVSVNDSSVDFKQHSDKDDYDRLWIAWVQRQNIYKIFLQTIRDGRITGAEYEVWLNPNWGNRIQEATIKYNGSRKLACGYGSDGSWWCHRF